MVVNFASPLRKPTLFRSVEPSQKLTVPVAAPVNSAVMLAVKVTDCPVFDGFTDETKVVVVWLDPTPASLLLPCCC